MKVISVCYGQGYHHMIPPFVNSVISAGFEPVIYTDADTPFSRKLNFTNRGSKPQNMVSKIEAWHHAAKEQGECLLLDIDTVVLKSFTLDVEADCIFTVDNRFSADYDYINLGFLYVRNPKVLETLLRYMEHVDEERARKAPYKAIDQMAFHRMIRFTKNTFTYRHNGITATGLPCRLYNHYDDNKLIDRDCNILHYKNRWQGARNPAPDKMKIINGYLDTPLRREDILGKKG